MLTRERLVKMIGQVAALIPAEEIDNAAETSGCDPAEGADWLPYYKAAGALLAAASGLGAGVCDGLIANPAASPKLKELMREDLSRIKNMMTAAMVIAGIGPNTDDATAEAIRQRVKNLMGE